ncbi:IS3 family transposase [bacterium]|nr:IS3 family transposase [bacterium]
MAKAKYKAEQIIPMLREAEVEIGKGKTVREVCRKLGIQENTYYNWRRQYGGLKLDQAKRLKELELENNRLRRVVADLTIDKQILSEALKGKILSPAKLRETVLAVRRSLGEDKISERRVCQVLDQPRMTQRYVPVRCRDEDRLTTLVIDLACQYGTYGYRIITGMIRLSGWKVNHKRVERIWRQAGLKVPKRQPKRRRLWDNDGSCIRLRPAHPNHVWSYDFVSWCTSDGRPFKVLAILDEFTRECLALLVGRRITSTDVICQLEELFVLRGTPEHIRSDNGPEFTANAVRNWLNRLNVQTLFITPGSPWENGYVESFNNRLKQFLKGDIFDILLEAKILIERWRQHYNTARPHSSLGYKPPAPETKITPIPSPLRYDGIGSVI